MGRGFPVDVKLAEVQTGDLPSADELIPVQNPTRPDKMGKRVPLNQPGTSSIHSPHMHVVLGLVRSINTVDVISPKALLTFLMKANSLIKLGLVRKDEILLVLLPKTVGWVMQTMGDCSRLNLAWSFCRFQSVSERFLDFVDSVVNAAEVLPGFSL
ncbi:hypothetical protein L798_04759 [Zootermopsis nevadensis]|uniref:Uncharacterized protein n=1 Tax=Zootermopsis nevadensis TaxID=136037 RepID=A0A067RMH8_ZOONE|nr:hypothetical protein L798_04759 [Zootermopsis nevadensis]